MVKSNIATTQAGVDDRPIRGLGIAVMQLVLSTVSSVTSRTKITLTTAMTLLIGLRY